MGRVKLQIKKIENTTNRQVTFSKRRNGLIKKAYELSVLCDVDVALIMFSPSGRVSVFSGNKSIEEIVERYVNLPEHERGRLQNQEYLHKVLGKLKNEADRTNRVVVSPPSADSQVEEVQQEILICKSHLEDMEKRLRNYEGDPWEIGTEAEADYREQVLHETLKQVRARKQALEEKYNSQNPETSDQVMPLQQQQAAAAAALQMNGFVEKNGSSFMIDWFPQREHDSIPALNFTGLLPLRDEGQQMDNILSSPSLNLLHASDMHLNNNDQNSTPSSNVDNETQPHHPPPTHHHQDQFGQVIDVNLSPWTDLYSPDPFPAAQPRERALLELFLSQLAPVNQDQI